MADKGKDFTASTKGPEAAAEADSKAVVYLIDPEVGSRDAQGPLVQSLRVACYACYYCMHLAPTLEPTHDAHARNPALACPW